MTQLQTTTMKIPITPRLCVFSLALFLNTNVLAETEASKCAALVKAVEIDLSLANYCALDRNERQCKEIASICGENSECQVDAKC